MIRILVAIAVLSACGNDSTTSAREVTTQEETKYETKTECEWQTQCRNVRTRGRGKWGRSCIKKVCERVQICTDEIVPVSI